MNLSQTAVRILEKRYLRKDEQGNIIETPEQMFRRVAHNIASAEPPELQKEWEEKFYNIMTNLEFLPNSPTLMNAGMEIQQLSACFVLPVEDSMEGIFQAIKQAALIHQSGGGSGFSFSRIRPKNDIVKTTGGQSSGPVSFMRVFNAATETVKQAGRRRGANMGILRIDHPDILEFITCKSQEGDFNNFNISVAVTDDFMNKLKNNEDYELINPRNNTVVCKLNTTKVWNLICTLAWKNGEPGVIFIDEMNRHNPTPELGKFEATNPCVTGDTLITTDKGVIRIDELIYDDPKYIKILTANNTFQQPEKIVYSGYKDVYEITLEHPKNIVEKFIELSGEQKENDINKLKCTKDHLILTPNGWRDIKYLEKNKEMIFYLNNNKFKLLSIQSIKYIGKEKVYDISEPITNSFIANGIVVHNCGESNLLPYESCNLGSINLSKFVENGEINYKKLKEVVRIAIRFLDNIIDINKYPLEEIKEATLKTRKIGLGVMGFADMLIKLKIPYNSDAGIICAKDIMEFIHKESIEESKNLREEKGSEFAKRWEPPIFEGEHRERNSIVNVIAPTGTISMIADCSSGIEPLFALAYKKENVLDGESFEYIHPEVEKILKLYCNYKNEIVETGRLQHLEFHPNDIELCLPLVTSQEISPEWHIKMQASFQKYTDNAVSKTINMPNSATVGDVKKAYLLAYSLKCKGITIYRDGSRHKQILSTNKQKENAPIKTVPRKRPCITEGTTEKIVTGDGNLFLTINKDKIGLCEIFMNIGKHGSYVSSWSQALGRLLSICFRANIPLDIIIKQLIGIESKPIWINGKKILSVPDAIGQKLQEYIKEEPEEIKEIVSDCPDCGSALDIDSSCLVCKICGYSKC